MRTQEITITRIGNSRGMRLPAATLRRYGIGSKVLMEERPDEIAIRPIHGAPPKLGWEETARQMAVVKEDWAAWDCTSTDGLRER